MSLERAERQRGVVIRMVIVNFVLYCLAEGYQSKHGSQYQEYSQTRSSLTFALSEDEKIRSAALTKASSWLNSDGPIYVKDSRGTTPSALYLAHLESKHLHIADQVRFGANGTPMGYDHREGHVIVVGPIDRADRNDARVTVKVVWSLSRSYTATLKLHQAGGEWYCLDREPTALALTATRSKLAPAVSK